MELTEFVKELTEAPELAEAPPAFEAMARMMAERVQYRAGLPEHPVEIEDPMGMLQEAQAAVDALHSAYCFIATLGPDLLLALPEEKQNELMGVLLGAAVDIAIAGMNLTIVAADGTSVREV